MLPPTTIYLTGVRNGTTDELASYHDTDLPLGLLAQPLTRNYLRYQHLYAWVGIDNGCFTKVGQARFSLPQYLSMIDEGLERFGDNLLFATAPDVAFDWQGTLEKSLPVLPQIRRAGAPAALVLQDGATEANVPWDELDCVFIGGSTEWKVGREARSLCAAANRRGKWVHMGRVNSESRMITAQDFGVGSADGTHLLSATRRAVAVEAVSTVLKATRWPGRLSPAQAEARDRTLAALAELVSPSEAARRRAVETLHRLQAPEAALRLARPARQTRRPPTRPSPGSAPWRRRSPWGGPPTRCRRRSPGLGRRRRWATSWRGSARCTAGRRPSDAPGTGRSTAR